MRPDADRTEVTEAFRRYALRHHPDRGGDPVTFQYGLDAYRHLTRRRPPADVVFHRRARPGLTSLLRQAGRRLAAALPRS